jgi:release factor glutamine methyltransferase
MNAELLLMFTLDCDRAHLYGHPERELTADEVRRYDEALARRTTGEPAQYITGHQEFWGMDLIVTPAVLIPRPETEHVVETVLELMPLWRGRPGPRPLAVQHDRADVAEEPIPRIVDVGTGSGAIALALAKELPSAEIYATDISTAALEVARANAAKHQLRSRVHFHRADLLSEIFSDLTPEPSASGQPSAGLPRGEFDFVVSNPPYVGESEEDQVQLEVRKFEPRNAVFAGPTGLEVIERLIPQACEALRPGGWLIFEISGTIAEGVRGLLAGWDDVVFKNDLQGIARVAIARKPS